MTSASLTRRSFLAAAGATGAAAVGGRAAWAQTTDAEPDTEPYGPLGEPDANGIRLPDGFTSRVLARSGEVVEGSKYTWHDAPDGGATFPMPDGGWVYVSNSEVRSGPTGGVGALRFGSTGEVVDSYPILEGTMVNCAGGPTPWSTWLSCEEFPTGQVWECDPAGVVEAAVRPALGSFTHEAVAVDPDNERLYMTEDVPDGRFYRFTPDRWPSLEAGQLEVAMVDGEQVTWLALPDPDAESMETRLQVPESTAFSGGEGLWFDKGIVYFTTKGDGRVWRLDPTDDNLTVLHEPPTGGPEGSEPVLDGVDNITVSSAGELFVCEDHAGEQDIVVVASDGSVGRLLRVTGQPISELTGVAIAPAGDRLYFSSQRGVDGPGITYEITGPFRTGNEVGTTTTTAAAPSPSASTAPTTAAEAIGDERSQGDDGGGEGGSSATPFVVAGGVGALLVVAAAGAWRLRTRRDEADDPPIEDGT